MKVLRRINGIVHWCRDDSIIWSRGHRLYLSEDGGRSTSQAVSLGLGPVERVKSACRLSERLFRQDIIQAIELADNLIGLVSKRGFFRLSLRPFSVTHTSSFPMYPPFRMGWNSEHLVYGEYFRNPGRRPVDVWVSHDLGTNWRRVYTFSDIRHVHSCHYDKFSDSFWIASGDLDQESFLRTTNDLFRTVTTVVGGSQSFRAIDLIFEQDHILFGTDTPLAKNYLMRLDRATQALTPVLEVGGSVFYLRKCPQGLICSTSVEPSDVNLSRQCEVWFSRDADRWVQIGNFEKDRWSMRYFQFGRVQIPSGKGTSEGCWASPIGAAHDGRSLLLAIPEPSV